MKKHGFTLIELLVVISIIALLSSIVLAAVTSARVKARDIALYQSAIQMRNALELYRIDHNGYYPGQDPATNSNPDLFSYQTSLDSSNQVQVSYSPNPGLDLSVMLAPYLKKIPAPAIQGISFSYYHFHSAYLRCSNQAVSSEPPYVLLMQFEGNSFNLPYSIFNPVPQVPGMVFPFGPGPLGFSCLSAP